MEIIERSTEQSSLFSQKSYWFKAILILMFILAVLVRLKNIKAPGHLVEREFTSAIFARAYFFKDNDNIAPWRQVIAEITKDQQPVLEPPITEYLVSMIYRFLDNEEMWYARYLTNAFWLIGGIFMYKITKFVLSPDAALVATSYYLFVPMGVIISRSFQPDALMMMLLLMSLYYILMYFDVPTIKRLFFSATLTGVTLLVRPLVIFTLFFAFLALMINKKGRFIKTIDRRFIIFWGVCLIIPFAYYGYGILIADFLRWKITTSFRPHLFLTVQYWKSWFEMSVGVAGQTFVISALIGFLTLPKSLVKVLIVSFSLGFLIFGLVFNYHIITHPYYHIQIFPIICLSAAPFIVTVAKILKRSLNQYWWIPATAIFLFGLYFSYSQVRDSLYNTTFEDPSLAREIGEIVDHSNRTVFIAYHYGVPLVYYGEFSGTPWPVRIDDPFYRNPNEKERSVQERMDSLGFQPEYFIITDFGRYYFQHQDLKKYLETYCSIYAQTDSLLIYNSCPSIKGY